MKLFWKLLSCVVLVHFGIAENELCASPQYLTLGQEGTVVCDFHEGSFGTYWYDTEDTNRKPFFYLQEHVKRGEGFESGDFDVHENGSLIIKSVSLDHDRIFTVVNLRTKDSNPTEINIQVVVTVIPDNPHPSVDLCVGTAYCYVKLKENTVPVGCFANNSRPQVELSWKLRTVKGDRGVPFERKISEVNGLFTTLIRTDQYAIESDTFLLLLCEQEERLPLWNRTYVIVLLEINQPRLNHAEQILVQMITETTTLTCLRDGSSFFIWKRQLLDGRLIVLAHGSSGHIAIANSNYTLVNESSLVIPGDQLWSGGIYVCYYGDGFENGMVVYNVTVPSAISSVSSSSTDSPVKSNNSSSLVSVIVPTAIIALLALSVAMMILWRKRTGRETQAKPLESTEQDTLILQKKNPERTIRVTSSSIEADLKTSGRPNIYTLRYSKETIVVENCKIRKCEIGTKGDENFNEKVIMLVGEVGAGKTTLIRHLINYFLGVSWEDPYRFDILLDVDEQNRIHDPSKIQTGWISVYSLLEHRIDSIPFVITLVDTPGISGELSKDKAITENTKSLFESDVVDHVDIIAFVRKVSDQRLTQSQKYVIDSVLQLFGKDIIDNMYLFGTYASSIQNETLERAVRNSGLYLAGHFYFNNRPFPSSLEGEDETLKPSWEMSRRQFEKVSDSLAKCSSVNLDLTTRMLKERLNLQVILKGLRDILQTSLTSYNNFKLQEDALSQKKEYIEVYDELKEVPLENDDMALICTRCKNTCHYPCTAEYALKCDMIKFFGGCRRCKENCDFIPHFIKNYRYERMTKTRTITDYCETPGTETERQESLQQISEQRREQKEKIVEQVDEIRECIRKLNENSPQGGDLTVRGYLNKMIEAEIKTKRAGWEERISELNNLIKEIND